MSGKNERIEHLQKIGWSDDEIQYAMIDYKPESEDTSDE